MLGLKSDIFWSVFVAMTLGFIGSLCLQKYKEQKENIDNNEKKKQYNKLVLSLLKNEVKENYQTASKIKAYLSQADSLSGQPFIDRPEDCFHLRFQMTSKNSLWMSFVEAINAADLADKVSSLYAAYEYCNNSLSEISTFINNRWQGGNVGGSYKQAIREMPWKIQLNSALLRIEEESINIEQQLSEFLK